MAKAPTYQELNREKADAAASQAQTEQKTSMANDPSTKGTPNPVLSEYMNRNKQPEGLNPRAPESDYATLAHSIAKSVPDQETYGMTMADAAMKGQVPMEDVLADANISDQIKVGLSNKIKQSQGLGQLA